MRSNVGSLLGSTLLLALLVTSVDHALAQKTRRYAGYGAGIGALVGVVAGGDIRSAAVGAAVGAAGGAITGSIADDKDQAAAAERQQAEAEAQAQAEAAAQAQAEAEAQAQADAQAGMEAETVTTAEQEEQAVIERIGQDNYQSYLALRACEFDRAVALANAGATSSVVDHQLASLWLQAVIATDRREAQTAEEYLPQIVEQDFDIDTVQQASLAVDKLVLDLRQERRDLDMPPCG